MASAGRAPGERRASAAGILTRFALNLDYKVVEEISRFCPKYVQVQWLSNICLPKLSKLTFKIEIQALSRVCLCKKIVQSLSKHIFLFSKAQNETPDHSFYKSNICPECVQMEKFQFHRLFGQYLDKLWILRSNLCPPSGEICGGLTKVGPGGDRNWTDPVPRHRLDIPWT